jgi:prevent-host-death family protein
MVKPPRIIPISDLRQKTSEVFKDVNSGNAVFITQRGRAAAVLVSMKSYEELQDELDILRQLARGEKEIQSGQVHEMEEVFEEADRLLGASES